MCVENQIHLLDELQNLLEKHLRLARQGNVGDIKTISRQAELIEKIVSEGVFESDEFENRKERLQKLYRELNIALAAQKGDVAEKLEQVRKGRKIVGAYRRNI